MSEPRRNCRSCYYRNTTWIGSVEASASCDHPDFLPEGRGLTLTEFQAPEWCPLGVAQPLRRDTLIDLPVSPTIQENPSLKHALLDWATRGNMTHKDAPSDLERAVQFGAASIREAEDKRILDELHARAADEYREAFNRIAESGFDHSRKAAYQRQFQESDFIVTDRSVIYPESYAASEVEFVGEIPLRVDVPVVPKECPRCGSPTQTTHLTPPDVGDAYGCTRCSWPTGETP